MNKKSIFFISAVIILVIVLIFITGKYPPPGSEESGGTIGKVEKYRKVQMTAKDIILRSEVISDTSQLSRSIYGLMIFNSFTERYAEDLMEIAFNMDQCELTKEESKTVLRYSRFISDNRRNIENIIALLTDFYTNDTTDFSIDIEKKLTDFDIFVKNMVLRDSLVTGLISATEKNVKSAPKRKDEEIRKLKNIHDQLLVKKMQLALLIGNKDDLRVCSQSTLFNINNLGIFVNDKLGIASSEKLSENLSNKNLGCILSEEKLSSFNSKNIGSVVLGDLFNKQFSSYASNEQLNFILDKPQLGYIEVKQLGEQVSAIANSYIGIVIPNTVSSKELQNVLSNSISNQAVQQKVLSSSVINNTLGAL